MKMPAMIAIDGPAASGKSTLAEKLAASLGYLYFDTGVMYRAVTYAALQTHLDLMDEPGITGLAERMNIDVRAPSVKDGRKFDVWLSTEDVTWKIRQPEVDASVSVVSAYPGVRSAMTGQQRRIARRGQVVMVGRDIGTVVIPEAKLKIYLDASVEARAKRRTQELAEKGQPLPYEQVLTSMKRRDELDRSRACAPLRPAEDAIIINSDHLTIEEVLEMVNYLIAK